MTTLLGLSDEEVAQRAARFGRNELPGARPRPLVLREMDQLREPMNLLLLAAAAVSGVALSEPIDALAITAIVLLNSTIALVQEGRANRALAALEQLGSPEATVVRGGRTQRLAATELVPGDLVRVEAGDRVPADATLVEAADLEVDESMLTGESIPVAKTSVARSDTPDPAPASSGILWGTFITRGTGTAVVSATGPRTELGRIARALEAPAPPTPLQHELSVLSARLGAAAVAIATIVFVLTLARVGVAGGGIGLAFLAAVALAVAAVPEGLPTVTLVALAVGVRRMARHHTIVRRLPAVETLGCASVIVTDKTGTVTENRMAVRGVWSLQQQAADRPPACILARVRRVAALANDASLDPPTGDPMEQALLTFSGTDEVAALRTRHPRLLAFPLDSERRMMSSANRGPDGAIVTAKGAPESVLERCGDVLLPDGSTRPLTPQDRASILARAHTMAAAGGRLLALADRSVATLPRDVADAEQALTFVALAVFADPVRPTASPAVAEATAAGIQVIMATGDHPATAAAIAREIGLRRTEHPLTGADLVAHGLPDDPRTTAVYARVDPGQKLDLVAALQGRGEVVAMTGDGVNDAPALRRADIGVALGGRSSDVAREAADMIVTDDDLASIVTAAREGRGIYDDIRKVVDYLIAGNLSEVGVVLGALLLLPWLGVPLLPLQLLWVNLLTDALPAFALGVDRHDEGLMRRRPRPRTDHLLHGHRLGHLAVRGLLMAGACLAAGVLAGLAHPDDPDHVRTVLLTTLVVLHLLYSFVARQPEAASLRGRPAPSGWFGSPLLVGAVLAGLASHAVILLWAPARAVFGTTSLGAEDWSLVAGGAAAGLVLTVLHRRLGGGTAARHRSPN